MVAMVHSSTGIIYKIVLAMMKVGSFFFNIILKQYKRIYEIALMRAQDVKC